MGVATLTFNTVRMCVMSGCALGVSVRVLLLLLSLLNVPSGVPQYNGTCTLPKPLLLPRSALYVRMYVYMNACACVFVLVRLCLCSREHGGRGVSQGRGPGGGLLPKCVQGTR